MVARVVARVVTLVGEVIMRERGHGRRRRRHALFGAFPSNRGEGEMGFQTVTIVDGGRVPGLADGGEQRRAMAKAMCVCC
jgi:hypothetical protein